MQTLGELLAARPPDDTEAFDAAQVGQLLEVYYRHISPSDLQEHDPQDLLGALIAHWRLMRRRRPDEALVRVYNPDQEEDGWRSRDTIIEVVVRDMPFLVDSISAELNRRGLTVRFTIHPVFGVVRDGQGRMAALLPRQAIDADATAEAAIQLHVDRQPPEALEELQLAVLGVLEDVSLTTADWLKMQQLAQRISDELGQGGTDSPTEDIEEARQFLNWMINDHFLFIGSCAFASQKDAAGADGDALAFEPGSGLGMLRADNESRARAWISGLEVALSGDGNDLMVTKANARSSVHRPAYMDCVTVRRRDAQGAVVGLCCLIGLFSAGAYSMPPRQIPLLRRKVARVFEGAEVSPQSHSGRAIANILDNFPRDALFQASADDLLATTLGVLGLQERQRTRLFVLEDPFHRFITCLVYLPRERYSREVRLAIQGVLQEAFAGTDVVFDTQFSESILARIQYVVWMAPGTRPAYDLAELEERVVEIATTWQDALRAALYSQMDETTAAHFFREYASAFPGGYREDCHPRVAVGDIERMERARSAGSVVVHLYHPIAEGSEQLHVRLYSPDEPLSLSRVIPILEHMGLGVFGERPYRVRLARGDVWIHDFSTRRPVADGLVTTTVRQLFIATFLRVWDGEVENDSFNGLVLLAGLSWREVMVFRAYSRYLHQIKVPYTEAYMAGVLGRYPQILQLLHRVFQARFDPGEDGRDERHARLLEAFEQALEQVAGLDEDRILRSFLNLIEATLRTNFYQQLERPGERAYLSLKFDPRRVDGMPAPRPMFEIFVYAAHMEGVHLRGGKVARGGLRWSDRMEDYRTEVLGLMKAQMVKNTVIVPVGSKGGFIVRNLDTADSREQQADKVITAYRTLLRGMLDITDNLVDGDVVPPDGVVRHDEDDPYLVIAADKGTASFSDIANAVSADYGFWLGDAFASGGSAGYDHKAMGITARGAWESVKRNFRELGLDTQRTDFSVVGIGDMSGDVFGNGMLLSPHIRLVAAFNHRHIFLDPDPDPQASFAERSRLFALPRSAWSDYDRHLISNGGGIHARDAKSIEVTAEVRALLGLEQERATPNELIRAILKAPVDLLWNGGIGTYVKAASETHAQVSDKSNDALRVDANELRCRVVGEGGNLGFTQLARVEYAANGGQIYTDAIDNSAGVDCSDHEVNIKILLNGILANGDMTLKQRNGLLAEMTDEVAALVLADNYAQTEAISVVSSSGSQRVYEQARFIELLELKGGFDRRLEGLPDKKQLTERLAAGRGLSKPEIAVLLAYSKMNYYHAIIESDIPDDAFVGDRLHAYFPSPLRARFADEIERHALRREIIATVIAGTIADHVGPGIGFRVREEVGSDLAGVARAYLTASAIFETDRLWYAVESLDNRVPAAAQIEMLSIIGDFLEKTLTKVLRTFKDCLDMTVLQSRFHDGVHELWDCLPRALASRDKADFARHQRRLLGMGVPKELAQRIAGLEPMAASLDIVDVAAESGVSIEKTAWVHSALNHTLDIEWIERRIVELPVHTHWHLLARTKLQATLDGHRRALTAQILAARRREKSGRGMLENWVRQHHAMLERYLANIAEFKAGNVFDFPILSLVVARLGELAPTGPGAAPGKGSPAA
jgi:glutamate dehydrogenase